jgi:glycyl-tRNA synthetase beta chain
MRFAGLEYRQILKTYNYVAQIFKEELVCRDISCQRLEVFFSKFRLVLWLRLSPEENRMGIKAILTRAVTALCQRISLTLPETWAKIIGLLFLVDDEVLHITVVDIASGQDTLAGARSIKVRGTQHYWRAMARNNVIIDNELREKQIRKLLHNAAASCGGDVVSSPIMNEVVVNCEQPDVKTIDIYQALTGIPPTLALIVLEKQHFFALRSAKEQLLAKAVFICDQGCQPPDLNAELRRTRDMFAKDLLPAVSQLQDSLKSMRHLSKLGSIYDKQQRLQKIVLSIASQIDAGEEVCSVARQASQMAKLDLATSTCRRHPEFLGHMGGIIARQAGESEMVASAIIEHWHPSRYSSKLPHTLVGALLGVADRLDSICGQYYQSEFRLSQYRNVKKWFDQMIAIIASVPLDISTVSLLKFSLSLYESQGLVPWRTKDLEHLLKIYTDRLFYYLLESDFPEEVANALTASVPDNVFVAIQKAEAMLDSNLHSSVEGCAEACKLLDRIGAKEYNHEEAAREFLEQPEEIDLFEVCLAAREEVKSFLEQRRMDQALLRLAKLHAPLLRFVNCVDLDTPDKPLRFNRLSLLGEIRELYLIYGDFSLL